MGPSAQTTGHMAAARSYASLATSMAAKRQPVPATPEQRAKIDKTAKNFESSFLSTMLGQMFEGTEVQAPFGGGEGETAFRSFLMDAMGKSMTEQGGIGISGMVSREMLKMQGLS
jgi:flagellar protein FlgJ